MQSINLESILSDLHSKITHQFMGAEILENSTLQAEPASVRMIEKGLGLLKIKNESKSSKNFDLRFPKQCIVYLFPISGNTFLNSTVQSTSEQLNSSDYGIMAYPFENWDLSIEMSKNSSLVMLCLTLQKVHELFDLDIQDKIEPKVLAKNYRMKKFLSIRDLNPSLTIVLKQLIDTQISHNFSRVYQKAKVLEILTLYMEQSDRPESAKNSCPVVTENLEEEKVRRVEKILVSNMYSPPSIPELAKIVGTNELKLKNSFKKVYGNTIYGYLMDFRMDSARIMLDKGNVQIKDVAFNVGYSNPSHFIAAFKKKFGLTPKKYLLQV